MLIFLSTENENIDQPFNVGWMFFLIVPFCLIYLWFWCFNVFIHVNGLHWTGGRQQAAVGKVSQCCKVINSIYVSTATPLSVMYFFLVINEYMYLLLAHICCVMECVSMLVWLVCRVLSMLILKFGILTYSLKC